MLRCYVILSAGLFRYMSRVRCELVHLALGAFAASVLLPENASDPVTARRRWHATSAIVGCFCSRKGLL